jgi:hypothetical protein
MSMSDPLGPSRQASSIPAFSSDALTVEDAAEVLSKNLNTSDRFWPIDIGLNQAIRPLKGQLVGHQQVTDAYLLGLAVSRKGTLATLDRGILELLPPESPHRTNVELIARA